MTLKSVINLLFCHKYSVDSFGIYHVNLHNQCFIEMPFEGGSLHMVK